MKDPWNPSYDEIREWAYTPGAMQPCQDWDLAIEWTAHERVLFELASDEACPARRFMLKVLYLIVGDAVRSNFHSENRPFIEGFIRRGTEYPHPDITRWQARSHELLRRPELFDYDQWCAGGLAQEQSND